MSHHLKIRLIDQSESEPRLHRIFYAIKYLRASLLNFLLLLVALALYHWCDIEDLYPGFGKWLKAVQFDGADVHALGIPPVLFALITLGLIALSLWWIYLAFIRGWQNALRVQAALFLFSALVLPLGLVRSLLFALRELHPILGVLQLCYLIFNVVFVSDLAVQMWRVAGLKERSAFVATLDGRLVSGAWSYLNKLLDLPRSPVVAWRFTVSYLGALVAASILVLSGFTLMKFGDAPTGVYQLYESCRDAAPRACFDESRAWGVRAAIELALALVGLRVAAFLQVAARRFGAVSIPEILDDEQKRFILYLRPFDTDDIVLAPPKLPLFTRLVTSRPFPLRVEEELFDVADGYLPLVTIARPTDRGDHRRTDLAHRVFLPDVEWKPYVQRLIERASFIVMVVRATDGVAWELDQIFRAEALRKTLFFFDPLGRGHSHWQTVERKIVPIFVAAGALPPDFQFETEPIAFTIGDAAVTEYRNDHWTATSYRTIFSTFLADRTGTQGRARNSAHPVFIDSNAGSRPAKVDATSLHPRPTALPSWLLWASWLLLVGGVTGIWGCWGLPWLDRATHPFGQKLTFRQGELYYAKPVTAEEAQSVGTYLVDDGYFSASKRVSVQLGLHDGIYRLCFVANTSQVDERLALIFAKIGNGVSRLALKGAPLEVALCDEWIHPVKVLPQLARLSFLKGEIYYSGAIAKAEAQRVGDNLVAQRYFSDEQRTMVYLDRQENAYRLWFVVEPERVNDSIALVFAKIGSDVSEAALAGARLSVTLCDRSFKPARSLPQIARLVFGKGELYYSAPITETTANDVGTWLRDAGFFTVERHASVFLGRADDAVQLRYVVDPSRVTEPKIVAAFEEQTLAIARKSLGREPVVMHLCDSELQSLRRERLDLASGKAWSDMPAQ